MRSFYASIEIASLGLDTKTTPLVVVSKRENYGSGLVMSASPVAKEMFGLSNVSRARDLPKDPRLLIATPRMDYYIKQNMKINEIFNRYTSFDDIYSYSIDESLLDMTHSWNLFGDSPFDVALKIQKDIKDELFIDTKIGIAPTLTMAKIALDVDAKKHPNSIAVWKFDEIPQKLWPIGKLESVWSIGKNTALKLNSLGIFSVYDLAHTPPYELRKHFGQRGETLFALAYGVDRGVISQRVERKEHGLGNSQVLPKDYIKKEEIHLIISEITDHVIKRVHEQGKQVNLVSLGVGFALNSKKRGFSKRHKMPFHTSDKNKLNQELITLFDQSWDGSPVRYVSVGFGGLQDDEYEQTGLFDLESKPENKSKQEEIVEKLQDKFGFKAVFKASSKLEGGTALYRSSLVGGHNAKKD